MKCPLCSVDLVMADRQGIEIDYCPKCRGIWLDRGEIDKIVERSQGGGTPPGAPGRDLPPQFRRHDDDDRQRHAGHGYYGKKRKGLLSELFDFD